MSLVGAKKSWITCLLSLSMLGCVQTQAAETVTLEDVQRLEREIKSLQRQLDILKRQTASYVEKNKGSQVATRGVDGKKRVETKSNVHDVDVANKNLPAPRPSSKTSSFELAADSILKPVAVESEDNELLTALEYNYHGPSVATSPALGARRSAEDARDLITFLPSINDDLAVLKYRQRIQRYLEEHGIKVPERPVIALSGSVEAEVGYRKEYDGGSSSNIDLSGAELDVMAEVSPWVTAMMMITYDSGRPKGEPRINNSRLRLDKGYITIGNLEQTPFYFSIGQMYAPFGTYSSYRITDAPTKIVGRTKDRLVVLGYGGKRWEAQVFGLGSELRYQSGGNIMDHLGANLAYRDEFGNLRVYIGASYTGALAESKGILLNAFEVTRDNLIQGSTLLHKKIRGADVRARVGYKKITLLGEYVTALERFDVRDMSFNGMGAKPRALELDAAFECKTWWGRPSTFGIGWGQSWESLAIKLPRSSYFITYNVAILKNTILGLEYRHDLNYRLGTTAKGSGTLPPLRVRDGRHQDVYTMKLGVYF